ncbi:type I restriction endonuclease subunit R, EcoR124 family, partial [Mycoplasmoides pneumoniae]
DILNEFIEDLGKSFEKEKLEEVWKTEGKLRECLKDFCKKKEESNKKKIINDFLVKGVFLVEWVADKQLNTAKKKGEYSPSWSDTEKLIWKEKSTNLPTMTEKDEDGNFKWRKLITD